MSRDNPSRHGETDKPGPPAPAPDSGGTEAPWQRHETRSRGQLAKDVTSRPPIRRFEPVMPSETGPVARQGPAGETAQRESASGPGTDGSREHDRRQGRSADGTTDETAGEQGGKAGEKEPRDPASPHVQPPDVSGDPSDEVSRESALDQQPEDPRWAVMEQRMQAIEERDAARQAEADTMKAENTELRRHLDAREARNTALEVRNNALEARVGELEGKLESVQRDAVPDQAGQGDRRRQAEMAEEQRVPAFPADAVQRNERGEQPRGSDGGQPRWEKSKPSQEQKRSESPESQTDRPGWLSNAKLQVYGTIASGVITAGAAEFLHGLPAVIAGVAGTAVVAAGNLVPVIRERSRKGRHGD